ENPGIAEKAQTVFQIKLTDPESLWTIDLKAGNAGAGETAKPDCTLELSEENYIALQKGEADPMKLFGSGKLKVSGDMMATSKLEALGDMSFELVMQKAAERSGGSAGAVVPAAVEPTSADIMAAVNEYLSENPGIAEKAQTVFQIKLTDPESLWTIDLKAGNAGAGETAKPDCTLELSEENYIALQKGEADPMKLFGSGKLKVSGDMMATSKLEALGDMSFDLVMEKAAARAGGASNEAAAPAPKAASKEPVAAKVFEALGKRLGEQPGLAAEVGAVLQFYVRDPDTKWVVDLKNDPPAYKTGETDGATTTLILDDADLASLARGDADPQALYQQGKLRVDGDIQPAHRLTLLKGLI
ncbi:MAG: SCP2 sterol-binding domain-containing protein, partial [Myxococcota bacterium]